MGKICICDPERLPYKIWFRYPKTKNNEGPHPVSEIIQLTDAEVEEIGDKLSDPFELRLVP